MSYLFALLYVICFIVAVVFCVKTLLGKRKGNDTNKDKVITIIAFVLFVVFFILTGITNPAASDNTSSNMSIENDNKQYEKADEKELPAKDESTNEVAISKETTEDNSANEMTVSETTEDKTNAITSDNDTVNEDVSIIVRDGHPTYYGSVEESHKVWDDVENGKIHFGDKNYGHSDKPILAMDAYRNEDVIRSVLVSFTNFSENPNYGVDDVIPIIASYMPYDVMDKWYEYRGSEHVVSDDGSKDDYYVISYSLTDKGSDAYYSKEHSYSGSIDVIIEVKDDIVQSFNITFGKPRWMMSLSKNSYHTEEWSCNLYDYR